MKSDAGVELVGYLLWGFPAALVIVLRLFIRDSLPLLATIYYATPLPLLWVAFIPLAIFALASRKRRLLALLAVMTISSIAIWIGTWPRNSQPPTSTALRVVFWNAGRKQALAHEQAAFIARLKPSIFAVVEVSARSAIVMSAWKNALPDHHIRPLGGGMLIGSSHPISSVRFVSIGRKSRFNEVVVQMPDGPVKVVIVDIEANPFRSRKEDLRKVLAALRDETYPLIVAGDFNTPRESKWFDAYRADGLRHVFEDVGKGRPETWPAFMPLLSLDHIWVSSDISAARCQLAKSRFSDHLAVVADLR